MSYTRTIRGRREVWVPHAGPWPYGRWLPVGVCGWTTIVTSFGSTREWRHALDCTGTCQVPTEGSQ